MSKNPDMAESTAWAVATQQAHATGKSPKGYGTAEGRSEAKKKMNKPKKEYTLTASPKTKVAVGVSSVASAVKGGFRKLTNADSIDSIGRRIAEHDAALTALKNQQKNMTLAGGAALGGAGIGAYSYHQGRLRDDQDSNMGMQMPMNFKFASAVDGESLSMFAGFANEMQTLVKEGGAMGEMAKRFGNLVAGGKHLDKVIDVPTMASQKVPRGIIGRALGLAPKEKLVETTKQVTLPGAGGRVGSSLSALKNPETRGEAAKVLAARGAAATGVGVAASEASRRSKERQQERMGRAYMSGARDMYARSQGY
jgi:hypothetical protein